MHPAQGGGPLRVGVREQGRGTHPGALLTRQISLPPPSEAGSPTQGWGQCPRQSPVARYPLPGPFWHAHCAHLLLHPGWGHRAAASWGSPASLSPIPPGNGTPITERGTCRSPTLPSSLPTRGEGMHQPGFTHFSFRCLGSEGTIRPRDWLPAGLLPMAFTSLGVGGGEFPGRERGWAAPGSSLEGWGMRYM